MVESYYTLMCSNPELGIKETDVIDQFIAFFLAGTDTSAHISMMMIFFATQYPE